MVGVFPTKTPSTSISAVALEDTIETVAEAPGAAEAGGNTVRAAAVEAVVTGTAEPRVWLPSVYTSNATPRLMLTSWPFHKSMTGAAGQNTAATPAVRIPVLTAWLWPDFVVTV